jgi:acyl dehydratase
VLGPIMTASADQVHSALLADDHQSIAVEFEFVDPIGPGRHFVGFGGKREWIQHGAATLALASVARYYRF